MTSSTFDRRVECFARLDAVIKRHLPGEQAAELASFARRFHAQTAVEDLEERNPEDLYGAIIGIRSVLERRLDRKPLITVFNPQLEEHGWLSGHTIAQIHHPDMPFIVDSFLMALARQDLILHCMHNVVLPVLRDGEGRFVELAEEGGQKEVVIHAEIDRLDRTEFPAFIADLEATLADVRVAVGDFDAMRRRVEEMIATLERAPLPQPTEEVDEARAFLHWLLDDNFCFLGARSFEIVDAPDGRTLRQVGGSELGITRNRSRPSRPLLLEDLEPSTLEYLLDPRVLQFAKSGTRSRVHRPAYPDYIALKHFDTEGNVIGESGVLGLYTSVVYQELPQRIPILRQRVAQVLEWSGYDLSGFDGKVLKQVLATYPRDELFQTEVDELFHTALGITRNHERNQVQVFVRQDRYGLFFSCLVYTPREIYNTALREQIQDVLSEELQALDAEFTSYFSESVLIRTHFMLRVDPNVRVAWDEQRIEQRIRALARNWDDALRDALIQEVGESTMRTFQLRYGRAFPSAYREAFDARMAVYDIRHMEKLTRAGDLVMRLYRRLEDPPEQLRLKVFYCGPFLPLSDTLPLLENLGVRVQEQYPYAIARDDGRREPLAVTIYDFALRYEQQLDLNQVGDLFEETFVRTWRGDNDNDRLNRLVLAAGIPWRDVSMLRAYGRYMKQIRFPFSQDFIADTLVRHADLTTLLVDYFYAMHDPDKESYTESLRGEILEGLDAIPSLTEDRVLRRYLDLIDATLRTNFFQLDAEGQPKRHLSFKLRSASIPDMPKPELPFEIYVFAPEVEGVHLRSGPIARGGLRWSDRKEDYRTEVLGLVKAQQVKNAVIVPEGAKGGFVIRQPTEGLDRDGLQKLGIACYSSFVRGMLDISDNRIEGRVVAPPRVRRHDGDDPYLVVAADKGTATFSDIANGIAAEYDFWLGDAFASGGSQGYDHKKMGITARGAWVSVQRHFLERGVNVQRDPVTALGIGDMSGDVFGNGMLLSESILLVAAFNHQHIFIDPDPDAAVSFSERQRLFALPRSSWADYDARLVSAGGGIFPRQQKSIAVSPAMRVRFGLAVDRMTPDELIHALLKAPVDLIWNGGIGTYVKASNESHADVGDKANDGLRIDGAELCCKVIGEGGNLGLTQLARIEAALGGVGLNTDFIDNAGGVDCSDHEVNLKILLADIMASGDLTLKQRNYLLENMTDAVADLVLQNNARQTQAISIAQRHSADRLSEYLRFLHRMEREQGLDRTLEQLPTDTELADRQRTGITFTRPELAVLLSYAKSFIKERLVDSGIAQDPEVAQFVEHQFPEAFNHAFRGQLSRHYLFEHIVATQVANELVDHLGITCVTHLQEYIGGDTAEVVRALLIVREVFGIAGLFERLDSQRTQLSMTLQLELMVELMRLGRRGGRWFLRHRRGRLAVGEQVSFYAPRIAELRGMRTTLQSLHAYAGEVEIMEQLTTAGVPKDLVMIAAHSNRAVEDLSIIDAAERAVRSVTTTAEVYARLASRLDQAAVTGALIRVHPQNLWQAMERDALLDDLVTHTCMLAGHALADDDEPDPDAWLDARPAFERSWEQIVAELLRDGQSDFSMYAMAVRKLGDLLRTL
ncbi:MAG: NAD-glutamate dehydrogenase [Gammaproteobacteria bacterium]|nr:MAG: NAD-glutamate dehydrogenase [Gammaproteobacteria bacterium]